MLPLPTTRLRFREMSPADLDNMSTLLGDPQVMRYYPAPKTQEEAAAWISWNQSNYARDGYGLWIIETHDGEFVGDCGLTWQSVNGHPELEVGYHVKSGLQGLGYATEAAAACKGVAREILGSGLLVAIIHPDNTASRRVAERIGMRHIDDERSESIVRTVMGIELS